MAGRVVEVRDEGGNGYELYEVRGMTIPTNMVGNLQSGNFQTQLEQVRTMSYKTGDVLICSYPKSGTHWLNNLLMYMLKANPVTMETMTSVTPVLLEMSPDTSYSHLSSPRILSTHLSINNLPVQLKEKAKLVYIVRNPKDVCVSFYHHWRKMPIVQNKQSWSSFVEHFMHGPVHCGTYTNYLNILQQELETNSTFKPHVVYYEDLMTDGVHELRKLQKYLDIQYPDSFLEQIVDRCDIAKLRQDVDQYPDSFLEQIVDRCDIAKLRQDVDQYPDSFLEQIVDRCDIAKLRQDVDEGRVLSPLVDINNKSFLYRKGEIGDWKNYFTVAQNEVFDAFWANTMNHSMFKFKNTQF